MVQRKFNGQRSPVHISSEGKVSLWGRLGGPHLLYEAPAYLLEEIQSLNLEPGKEYWLDGELLDGKTKNPLYKHKIILYDVLQAGRYLMGVTLAARLELLKTICRFPQKREPNIGIALQVTPNIWMAETFTDNFTERFTEFLAYDEIEGVVLKKLNSALDNFGNTEYEIEWLIRCRKPHKNYTL